MDSENNADRAVDSGIIAEEVIAMGLSEGDHHSGKSAMPNSPEPCKASPQGPPVAPSDTPETVRPEHQLPVVHLFRRPVHGRWASEPSPTLRVNDIIFMVSLLELANTVDIGANVFNAIPPTRIALIVMGIGGVIALLIFPFAIIDGRRSLRNLKVLSRERTELVPKLRRQVVPDHESIALVELPSPPETPPEVPTPHPILTPLDQHRVRWKLNTLEVGLEAVDRFSMDILMGFGALLVGVGTLLAMGGGNHKIYKASNLLTGYIGNIPPALSGLGNSVWSVYRWNSVDWPRNIPPGQWIDIYGIFRSHQKCVRILAMLNIWLGILGAAGSLMTASAYIHPRGAWGYAILFPCIIGQTVANRLIRNRVHYTRDTAQEVPKDIHVVLDDIRRSDGNRHLLRRLAKQYRRDKAHVAVAVDYLRGISRVSSQRPESRSRTPKEHASPALDALIRDLFTSFPTTVVEQIISDLANRRTTSGIIAAAMNHSRGRRASLDVAVIVRTADKDSAVASILLNVIVERMLRPLLIWEEESVRRNLETLLAMCRVSSRLGNGEREPKDH